MGLTRGKTDQVDAKRNALFAYKNRDDVRLWMPPRAVIGQLDRLTAQRARLVKVIKILQTPLTDSEGFVEKADRKANQQACAASLKALKADLKSADKAITTLAQQDPELKRLFERVTSVVGISQTTAAEIIVSTNEFKAITDPKKFACYAGVVPFERSSGKQKGRPQVSHRANKKLNHYFTWALCLRFSIVCSLKRTMSEKWMKARTKCSCSITSATRLFCAFSLVFERIETMTKSMHSHLFES